MRIRTLGTTLLGPALLAGALALGTGASPAQSDELNPLYPAWSVLDLVEGSYTDATDPVMLGTQPGSGDNPYFMPDWNNNGVFLEAADVRLEHNDEAQVAKFRYPCIGYDGSVEYELVGGGCAPDGTPGVVFRLGEIRKLTFVNSRGFRLAARLMLPEPIQEPGTNKVPGVVFSDGANFPASSFYAWDFSLVADGFMVMAYDQAGQGDSEGNQNPFQIPDPKSTCNPVWRNFCIDAQDAVRWFVGESITPVVPSPPHNPAYEPQGENVRNPLLSRLDRSRIGLIGQSAGSVATTSYTQFLADGAGMDGRPLPPVHAVVGMSGFGQASAIVPIQAQSADLDIPGITADNLGLDVTDGPTGTHAWYEALRATRKGNGALEEIIIESGSHGDTSNVVTVPHAVWSLAVSTGYATDWFGCHLLAQSGACASTYSPRPHLSRIVASEYDKDGPAGTAPSRCLQVPDQIGVGGVTDPVTTLQTLLGLKNYDCVR